MFLFGRVLGAYEFYLAERRLLDDSPGAAKSGRDVATVWVFLFCRSQVRTHSNDPGRAWACRWGFCSAFGESGGLRVVLFFRTRFLPPADLVFSAGSMDGGWPDHFPDPALYQQTTPWGNCIAVWRGRRSFAVQQRTVKWLATCGHLPSGDSG